MTEDQIILWLVRNRVAVVRGTVNDTGFLLRGAGAEWEYVSVLDAQTVQRLLDRWARSSQSNPWFRECGIAAQCQQVADEFRAATQAHGE